jgi:two-component system heavy metal sensor histidine kinase CusS
LREHPEDSAAIRQEVEVESARAARAALHPDSRSAGRVVPRPREWPSAFLRACSPEPGGRKGIDLRVKEDSFRVLSSRVALGKEEAARLSRWRSTGAKKTRFWPSSGAGSPLLAISLILCGIVGYQIARRGLQPVKRISETARTIRSTTLDERLPAAEFPAELAELAARSTRCSTGSGVLRTDCRGFPPTSPTSCGTPLNNIRGEVEVALGKSRSPEEYRETLGSFLEEAARLTRLIESLLFLARAEHPETQVRREAVDWERARFRPGVLRCDRRGIGGPARRGGRPAVPAHLDRTLVQRAVGNLVENALGAYSEGRADRAVRLPSEREVVIEVADTGCGIAAEHLPKVFDRLYRADRSRTASTAAPGWASRSSRASPSSMAARARSPATWARARRSVSACPPR